MEGRGGSRWRISLDLGLEVGEEGVEVAKSAGWVKGEEGSNLSKLDVEGGVEKREDSLVLGVGVVGWKWGDFLVLEEESRRVAKHLVVERWKGLRAVGDGDGGRGHRRESGQGFGMRWGSMVPGSSSIQMSICSCGQMSFLNSPALA